MLESPLLVRRLDHLEGLGVAEPAGDSALPPQCRLRIYFTILLLQKQQEVGSTIYRLRQNVVNRVEGPLKTGLLGKSAEAPEFEEKATCR